MKCTNDILRLNEFEAEVLLFQDYRFENLVIDDVLYEKYIIFYDDRIYVTAIDNTEGEAYTEDFDSLSKAIAWLEFDILAIADNEEQVEEYHAKY